MRDSVRTTVYVVIVIGWVAAVAFGGWRLWRFDAAAGAPARPPATWPTAVAAQRAAGGPTLVLLIHPRCPCSRATMAELAQLMAECGGKLRTTVLMLRPAGAPPGWERTDLWDRAAAIPGVSVRADDEGRAARQFGALTSGQAILYGADGQLLFSGGITESRGHAGDNAGRSAIAALVLGTGGRAPASAAGAAPQTPVYGCPLFDQSASCQKGAGPTCQQH